MNNTNNENQVVIEQILRSIKYIVKQELSHVTKCYDGLVVKDLGNGKWELKYNNQTHISKLYGDIKPQINTMVKIIVPQGNESLSWFFVNKKQ